MTSLKLIFEQSMKKMLAEKIDQANSQSEAKFADKCKILEDSYEERLKLLREELEVDNF